jgi:hypothetical protein
MSKKRVLFICALIVLFVPTLFGQSVEDDWNDFLHYVKIGRFNLAAGYGQAVLDAEPDSQELLELSRSNRLGYSILLRVHANKPDEALSGVTDKILNMIDDGRFIKRTNAGIINEEILRLSKSEGGAGTARGRMTAVKRLSDAGEYAIKFMIDALLDTERKDEYANIVWALPQIGRDSIRPMTCATQMRVASLKTELIQALGKLGYPQSLAYLKYIAENEESAEIKNIALESIRQIDPAATNIPASQLFFRLAENYYYHAESLQPAEDADFANVWFWQGDVQSLSSAKVGRDYFYELMSMRCCEWALKADPTFARAIGLWLAGYFKAESTGLAMPEYFGVNHAEAMVYAKTAGAEYLHDALARAIKDKNSFVALGCVEALASIGGEKSLMYQVGPAQPLVSALTFDNRAVKYSAAIAIAEAGPTADFPERSLIIENLAAALAEADGQDGDMVNGWVDTSYAVRAGEAMLKISVTRNRVIDVKLAMNSLVEGSKDERDAIKKLSANVLAYINDGEAQRAIAAMAMYEDNSMDVRIAGFESLALSAKMNANLLDEDAVDAIYEFLSSTDTDAELRSAAARAFGAMNLPSRKVKDLILDQAKS